MTGLILGEYEKAIISPPHSRAFFEANGTFLDCRGRLEIEEHVRLGFGLKIITASHDANAMILDQPFETMELHEVLIRRKVWVCSFALLYDCEIGEGALVGAGAVVKSVDVPPWHHVEGNPARVVARFLGYQREWQRLPPDCQFVLLQHERRGSCQVSA